MPEAAAPATTATPQAAPPPPAGTADAGTPPAESAAPGTSSIRPIPPGKPIAFAKPSLPGVIPDEGFPEPERPPRAASSPPARDAQGRFASTTPAQVGDHPGQAEDEPAPTVAEEAFEVAGEKFKSRAEFEQHFKSLRGNFKPLQSLAKTLGGMDQILPAIQKSVESAKAWKADSQTKDQRIAALEAELAAARGGQPATQATAESGGDQSADAGIDWELYAEIKRVATERGEPWKAEQWLTQQNEKRIHSRVEKLLNEKLAPLDQERQQSELAEQTSTLFAALGDAKNADGTLAYPELHDEASAFAVGRLWANLGLPPEAALTPQGAVAAIAVYRMARAGTSQAVDAAAVAPAPTGGSELPPGEPSDAAAAASLAEGRPSPVVRTDGSTSPEAARILSALRKVNDSKRAVLGFSE